MEGEIYIGNKEIAVYLGALRIQSDSNDSVVIKARGKAISKAVDVSQIAINNELKEWRVSDIKIGTEEKPYHPVENDPFPGKKVHKASFIEITISK